MYIAHSPPKKGKEPHYLIEHTNKVMELAASFSKSFDPFSIGKVSALMHDQGKKSDTFQKYIRSDNKRRGEVKHAMGGVLALQEIDECEPLIVHLTSLIVLGHHTGLSNYTKFENKLRDVPAELVGIENKILKERKCATELLQIAENEAKLDYETLDQYWYFSTLTRFCFSALIDADWLDTEAYFNEQRSQLRSYTPPTTLFLIDKLNNYMEELQEESRHSTLNTIRKCVYESAEQAALKNESFFALHAPTGSGKTLASLAFALHHSNNKYSDNDDTVRRVIFALPLTNLTEQTSEIYRSILGSNHVIEHHSQVNIGSNTEKTDPRKLAIENWERPFIITTTIQLFESLFTNQTNKARKLHRIANSIIIIDEYQKLPLHVLRPILLQLKILREHFGVTVVFMSATPLALEQSNMLKGVDTPVEIIEDYEYLYEKLERVQYKELGHEIDVDELITHMSAHPSVLCIVNTRKQAQEVFVKLKESEQKWDQIYHLSTTMCGSHRMETFRKIKQTKAGESIAVISTTILEAGVDVSFGTVFRMYGPLDSIIQSAGRCNREGESEKGIVYLFDLAKNSQSQTFYMQSTEHTKQLIGRMGVSALQDPQKCIPYFRDVYGHQGENALDKYQLHHENLLEFNDVADTFKMIEDDFRESVLCTSYAEFPHEDFEQAEFSRSWYRKMQPYLIPLDKKTIELKGLKKVNELYCWEGIYDNLIGFEL